MWFDFLSSATDWAPIKSVLFHLHETFMDSSQEMSLATHGHEVMLCSVFTSTVCVREGLVQMVFVQSMTTTVSWIRALYAHFAFLSAEHFIFPWCYLYVQYPGYLALIDPRRYHCGSKHRPVRGVPCLNTLIKHEWSISITITHYHSSR